MLFNANGCRTSYILYVFHLICGCDTFGTKEKRIISVPQTLEQHRQYFRADLKGSLFIYGFLEDYRYLIMV